MIYAVYIKNTGEIIKSIDIPDFLKDTISLTEGEALVEIPRTARDITEYIKDGVLTPRPTVDKTAE